MYCMSRVLNSQSIVAVINCGALKSACIHLNGMEEVYNDLKSVIQLTKRKQKLNGCDVNF